MASGNKQLSAERQSSARALGRVSAGEAKRAFVGRRWGGGRGGGGGGGRGAVPWTAAAPTTAMMMPPPAGGGGTLTLARDASPTTSRPTRHYRLPRRGGAFVCPRSGRRWWRQTSGDVTRVPTHGGGGEGGGRGRRSTSTTVVPHFICGSQPKAPLPPRATPWRRSSTTAKNSTGSSFR